MKPLSELQQMFCDGLRSAAPPSPVLLNEIVDDGLQLERFNVYRNNFVVLNGDALADMYPVIKRLLGAEAFRLPATAYVRDFPPMDRALLLYGERFADFLAAVPELSGLPYLADVARLEYAWTAAYHADDVVSLGQHQIAALPPDGVENLSLRPHPSMHCISSDYPIYSIWLANQGEQMEETISLDEGGSQVVVIRPKVEVEVREVSPGSLALLQSLASGETIGAAYAQAVEMDAEFDLQAFFARHLFDGTFCELQNQPVTD
ncbi:MAG: DNA-binding domain-containing protein [Candidatus Thiodiazotropha sp.]